MNHSRSHRAVLAIAGALLVVVTALAFAQHRKGRAATGPVSVQPVERRDIALTIEASGTVEPIDLVDVKSKASGQIVAMPVRVGSVVKRGDLLAQIDPRDVENQYAQVRAAMRAAQTKAGIAAAQKKRADELFAQQVITADEHETGVLEHANAQAQLVAARTDLELARQRREDATVRAPSDGTVLEQTVSEGQVITSATSSASGGTSLLKMADLGRIRVRALVSETDIGRVRAGLPVTVSVEAFPQRTFRGEVERVEPQAVVQQSLTLFPVLIAIDNESRALLPGMNGEVTILVDEREDVPAVPVDALRSTRELPTVAASLGLSADSVRAQLARQTEAPRARGDSTWRGRRQRSGEDGARGPREGRRRRFERGAGSADSAAAGNGRSWAGGVRGRRGQAVLVQTAHGLEARVVRIGISDFDYAEVVSGLAEGESVVLLGAVEAQATRTQQQERIRERVGTGLPGVSGGGGRGTGGGQGRTGGGGR